MKTDATVSGTSAPVERRSSRLACAGKYLIFNISGEEFGAEVMKIKEIMALQAITSIPNTAPYLKGVINLRGQVIPVVDLRIKFNLPPVEYNQRTCIVVVDTHIDGKAMSMGAIVDAVADVLTLTEADIVDTPNFGKGSDSPYLLGMARVKGSVKILVDIQKVLCSIEPMELERALAAGIN